MGRGKKVIDGQLSFDFSLDKDNYVVQANDLIGGKQALKLNSAKLIRAAIMQIVPEDDELKPYVVSSKEIAELLGVSESNLYRDIDDITDDIIKNPVFISGLNIRKKTRFNNRVFFMHSLQQLYHRCHTAPLTALDPVGPELI